MADIKKNKIGRNDPCSCGSKVKYKKCCLIKRPQFARVIESYPIDNLPPHIQKAYDQHQAKELTRIQQQGKGRPILHAKLNGQNLMISGNKMYASKTWQSVPDFLGDFIKEKIGAAWGTAEMQKPFDERHPILQWYERMRQAQVKHGMTGGKLVEMPITGAMKCYLGLAYNLYLLEHNNQELQEIYINRLKTISDFQGVYYELIVAGCLIKAGFKLELEDETDVSRKHCEFAAVSGDTGKRYSVEAKMRSEFGILGKTEQGGSKRSDPTALISTHLKKAFAKPADGTRLIFVDINTELYKGEGKPDWVERAGKKLDMKEKDLKPGQSAYVFITNLAFHRSLDDDASGHAFLAHGLGIGDFAKVNSNTTYF